MKIQCNRLDRGFEMFQAEFEQKARDVLRSGWYIMGSEVKEFEQEFADYIGVEHCIGVANGLDALWIAVRMLGIGAGDEVIVQANTYIASVMGITINGATPVFVEPDIYNNIDPTKIEEKITKKTKAIMVVHLYGQASKMDTIVEIANRYKLKIIEDCAQSHGASFNGKTTGCFGDVACFSFYPTKNLGAFGDGGAIMTSNAELANKIRTFRNYGSDKKYHFKVVGINSRLDEIHAGLLRVRLAHLDELIRGRVILCAKYDSRIVNPRIEKPLIRDGATSVWHQYVIKTDKRDELIEYLAEREIQAIIHYPIPPHLSEAYQDLGIEQGSLPITEKDALQILSLPLYDGMTEEELDYVIGAVNHF